MVDTIPQSRPGYTTVVDPGTGQLVNVPNNQSSILPSGYSYTPPLTKGGGGGYSGGGTNPPSSTTPEKVITQSTPGNQAAVQRQLQLIRAINAQRGVTQQRNISGTVSAYERPKGGSISEFTRLAALQALLRQQKFKTRGGKGFKAQITSTAYGVLSGAADAIAAAVDLPQAGYRVLTNPKVLLSLPALVKQQGKNFGYIAKTNPGEAVGYVAGNLVALEGTSRAINYISDLSRVQLTKLSTKYVGKLETGDKVRIPVGKGEYVNLRVVGSIPKSTIKKQLSLAGKEVPVAVSSQQRKLLGFIRRGKIIRKPIPGEERFTPATKTLLKKLDRGKINRRELSRLQTLIEKQGSKGALERSFFASTGGEIRPSRLGILPQKEAGITDYLTGDITFRKPKPQVLVFRKVKIQDFPKALKPIVKKIRAGKQLTQKESTKLLQYQLRVSGKFKPLGFISGEKEITLAPGELVKRKKVIGRAIIKGKSVPIVEAEVIKPSGSLKKLIAKAEKGTIKPKEIRKLSKELKRKTGFDYNVSYYEGVKKYINPRGYAASGISRTIRRYNYKGKFISKSKYNSLSPQAKSNVKIVKYSSKPRGGGGSPLSPPPPIKYPSKSLPPYYPGKTVRTPPKIIEKIKFNRGSKPKKKLSKAITTYNVYGKVGRKFVKLNTGVLSLRDALNKGSYAIDNTTAKTFKIVRAGKRKTVYGIPKSEAGYYNKANFKLRTYRIKRGKKFVVQPKYIEKRRYGIDTRGEKKGLTLAKYLKGKGLKTRNVIRSPKPRRRISPKQRKVLLKNLKKARRVLARKRR